MGFLNTDSLPHLVEKLSDGSNIKISGNSYGNRVSTVIDKIVEKADDVTKAIDQEVVNTSHTFKVGTGNVDVSSDVQDGFGEVGIKGVTYQNLLKRPTGLTQASISGDIIQTNHQGATKVYFDNAMVSPSKTYTLIFDVIENSTTNSESSSNSVGKFNIVSYNNGTWFIPNNATGRYVTKLTQPLVTTHNAKPYFELFSTTSGNIKFKAYLLEGDHTNNPNLPPYFEDVAGVGDKSKNLFNIKDTIIGFIDGGNGISAPDHNNLTSNYIKVKPNTKYIYTIGGYNTSIAHWTGWLYYKDSNNTFSSIVPTRQTKSGAEDSNKVIEFTTPSDCNYVRIGSRHLSLPNAWVQLEEAITATPYEPYYDGCKIEVSSNGKNLMPIKKVEILNLPSTGWGNTIGSAWAYNIPCKPNTRYYIKYKRNNHNYRMCIFSDRIKQDFKSTDTHGVVYHAVHNKTGHETVGGSGIESGNYFTTPSWAKYLHFTTGNTPFSPNDTSFNYELDEIMLCEADESYEPYQEDKKKIILDEPLMRLPNGVYDEITLDSKLIRRVNKKILTGTEWWMKYDNTKDQEEGYSIYLAQLSNKKFHNNDIVNVIGDNFASVKTRDEQGEYIYSDGWNTNILIKIKNNKLTSPNLEGFKQWLSKNPITVYYELKEPVITETTSSSLRIFKDGYITFDALVTPESTHLVQLNKSAQIERSIREVQGLDCRVDKLESFYDDMILETNHKLNLLNFDFECIKEREDI